MTPEQQELLPISEIYGRLHAKSDYLLGILDFVLNIPLQKRVLAETLKLLRRCTVGIRKIPMLPKKSLEFRNIGNISVQKLLSSAEKLCREAMVYMIQEQQANYYHVLGVSRRATREDIRKAFREVAAICQPAGGQDETVILAGKPVQKIEVFQLVTSAYRTLADDNLRNKYDQGLPKLNGWDEGTCVISGARDTTYRGAPCRKRARRPTMKTFGVMPANSDAPKVSFAGELDETTESMADKLGIHHGVLTRVLKVIGLK